MSVQPYCKTLFREDTSDNPPGTAGGNTFTDDTTHCTASMTQSHQQQQQQQPQSQMGTKRNRVLTRQPRVKRDSDSLSNNQISPEPTTGSLDFEPFSSTSQTLYTSGVHHHIPAAAHLHQHHHHHSHPHHLLSVPPRIERHSSEPAPCLSPTSPHLLTVPQSTPFLIKQHSDPLLPSQHSGHHAGGSGGSSSAGSLTNPFAPLHRQYSHPLSGSASGAYLASSAPLQHSHHISLPESIYETASPPPAGSSQYIVPQTANNPTQTTSSSNSSSNATTPASTASPTKSIGLPQFPSTYMSSERTTASSASSPPIPRVPSTQLSERSVSEDSQATVVSCTLATAPATMSTSSTTAAVASKFRSSKSVSAVMLTERSSSLQPGSSSSASSGGQSGCSSFEHLPTLRVRNEELQRSVSSPQTSREIITLENPRSSHCPVIRPGPALGCNFCWNTIDGHGRILRRKTKYHCPECQTNLCIVPCFQEYHERLNSELEATSSTTNTNTTSGTAKNSTNSNSSTNAGTNQTSEGGRSNTQSSNMTSGGGSRHYTKTETF